MGNIVVFVKVFTSKNFEKKFAKLHFHIWF